MNGQTLCLESTFAGTNSSEVPLIDSLTTITSSSFTAALIFFLDEDLLVFFEPDLEVDLEPLVDLVDLVDTA